MRLTIDRTKWLRGSGSYMMTPDGCGCVIGHYMVAVGVPEVLIYHRYGIGTHLHPFADALVHLGKLVQDRHESPYFQTTLECNYAIEINDAQFWGPWGSSTSSDDTQRESSLIGLLATMDCELNFV